MAKSPIFIHSLFRAGSTYVFSRLRRCPELYCYYESMHELVAWASEDVTRLDIESRADKMQQLHHPVLERPYFEELQAAWPAWEQALSPEAVYGGYFAEDPCAAGEDFFLALCAASPAQPLFSECRTAGRMPALKKSVGGKHAYLWRNPWDQWWSHQIDPYFNAATRIIAHANPLPEPLCALKTEFDIAGSPDSSFSEARDFYNLRPLDFEASYAWFYGLWLFQLDLAFSSADLLISIDALSFSDTHAREVELTLADWGVQGVDLSDANSPFASYSAQEVAAFQRVESLVHEVFIGAGWEASRLNQIELLSNQSLPARPEPIGANASSVEGRQARLEARASLVALARDWGARCDEQLASLRQAELDVGALYRVLDHDRRVFNRKIDHFERTAASLAAQNKLAQELVVLLKGSLSWRITAPLRSLSDLIGSLDGAVARHARPDRSMIRWMAARVSRSPIVRSVLTGFLDRAPFIRRRLQRVLDPLAQSSLPVSAEPSVLSSRGRVIYNKLAQELEMPKLARSDAEMRTGTDP